MLAHLVIAINWLAQKILLLIVFAQMLLIKAHAGISGWGYRSKFWSIKSMAPSGHNLLRLSILIIIYIHTLCMRAGKVLESLCIP